MIFKLEANVILTFSFIINLSNGFIIFKLNALLDDTSADRNEIAINEINNLKTRIKKEYAKDYKKQQKYQSPKQFFKNYIFNNYDNKLLVKRIIPHGLESTGMEYDDKYGTFYKPLIRIHTRNQNVSLKDKDKNEINFIINKEPKLKHFTIDKMNDDTIDQEFTTPFKITQSNLRDKFEVLKRLQGIVQNIDSRTSRLRAYDKIIKVLQNMLRSPQFEKSGEDNDPLAPGKVILAEEREVVTEKPKVWMPHYPPWNYWTYKKTIHQDECPGSQVKVGNLCIWTPPH